MGISSLDLAFFNKQLAAMIRLQTPLAEGLRALAQDVRGGKFKNFLTDMEEKLSRGQSLSSALGAQWAIPPTYVALVEAGEKSGDLSTALENMADYSETTLEMKAAMMNVGIIPLITLAVAIAIFLGLGTIVLPRFSEILSTLDVKLPSITQVVMTITGYLHFYFYWIIAGIVALIAWLVISFEKRMRWLDTLLLNLPFFGALLRTAHYTRFCMTMAHLLHQHIPLVNALALAQNIFRSPTFRTAVSDMRAAVENGEPLAAQVRASGIFPETMSWKLAFAEKKGDLPHAFDELKSYFLLYYRMLVPRAIYLVVPCLVILVGILVFVLILSVFLPIFSLQRTLSGV